jgi:uncharacterized protein (TIGR00255 family)
MLQSMTGYGRATGTLSTISIAVELKAVNSKSIEINPRTPSIYNEKEHELRKKITTRLERGTITLTIQRQDTGNTATAINLEALGNYMNTLAPLAQEYQQDQSQLMVQLLRLPDVMQSSNSSVSEEEFQLLNQLLDQAIDQLINFRKQEGASLAKDLNNSVSTIASKLEEIAILAPKRNEKIREQLLKKASEWIEAAKLDSNRFEQELIYYMERLDINEEIVRLRNHIQYFTQQLIDTNSLTKGKTLNFISQEMGREINTIGSKSNDADMQKLVVKMKDELEKIKEQTMNAV